MKMKLPEARESKLQFFKNHCHGPRMEFCHNQTDFSQTNKKAADGPFQKNRGIYGRTFHRALKLFYRFDVCQ